MDRRGYFSRVKGAAAASLCLAVLLIPACSRDDSLTTEAPSAQPSASVQSTTPIDYGFWERSEGFYGSEHDFLFGSPLNPESEVDVAANYLASISSGSLDRLRQTTRNDALTDEDVKNLRSAVFETDMPFEILRMFETSATVGSGHRVFVVVSPHKQVYAVDVTLVGAGDEHVVTGWAPASNVDPGRVLADAQWSSSQAVGKPAIYLYPRHAEEVAVSVVTHGRLTTTIPATDTVNGWVVDARPDGRLLAKDGKTYDYLFWEAELPTAYDMSTGFVVAGQETEAFLRGALSDLGLNARERADFVEYWLPRMECNTYNLIHFEGPAYEERFGLRVSPRPDTVIRVLMVFKPLESPVAVQPQTLTSPRRRGFTLVEWGGAVVDR